MASPGIVASHCLELGLWLLGAVSKAIQGCALPVPSAHLSGRGSCSSGPAGCLCEPGWACSVSKQAGLSFSLFLPTGTEGFLPTLSSRQKIASGERGQWGQGEPAALYPCQKGAVAAPAIFNLALLHAGSCVSCRFLPSLCLCVSLQLLPATVRCVNYTWPGKYVAGGIFKPPGPPVCRLLWRSLSNFASFSWECEVPSGSLRCWAVCFLPSMMQPLGPGLPLQDLGSSRTCVCSRGLSLVVVTVWLSGCQLQVYDMEWLFQPAKRCHQTWQDRHREDITKRLSCKACLSSKSLFVPSVEVVPLPNIWKLALSNLVWFGTSL